ncbi:hypothetical protein HY086_01925 [Candidatus Gottesmanbacteria bacterium]|nr:hypothetical protein [Candidatus Gottesmanbacteria bacterium]
MRVKTIFCLAIVMFAAWFLIKPLLQPGFFLSDDGEWMIIRLSAFFQSLRDGQFPVRFIGRLNHGFGYPVANFLYPGFLYLGSLIHVFRFSFADSVKLILAGSIFGAGTFVFLWLRVFFSWWASLFGAISFIFAPYLVFDLYTRGSVGEIFALLPASAALYALTSKRVWLLAPAIGLLVIGHNSLALLLLSYLVLYALTIGQAHRWLSFLLGIGGAAFFWIPALVEKQYVQFDATTISKYADYFLKSDMLVLLGPLFLLAAAATLMQKKMQPSTRLPLVVFIVSGLLATPISDVVWRVIPMAPLVQFPYRFLAVGMFAGAYLAANLFETRQRIIQLGIVAVAVMVFSITVLPRVSSVKTVAREPGFYETNEDSTTVADEYMPRWVKVKPTQHTLRKIAMVKGLGTVTLVRYSTRRLEANASSQAGSTIGLSTIYYPGWGVLVDDVPVPIAHANERGLIEFDVPAGKHHIVASFRETPLRLLADAISVISFIGYLYYEISLVF